MCEKCEENGWYRLYDARGIYVSRVCKDCVKEVKSGFRPEIFDDSNYECDEQIDEDY